MRVTRVAARQAHYVPPHAYRVQRGNDFRDVASTEAGSVGAIPGHLLGPSMLPNNEIIVPEPEEELTGTAQNGFQKVRMMRCIDCGAAVPETRTLDHVCG